MRIMLSAGEASGDLHGASLARELKALYPEIELVGMGGAGMEAAGVEIIYDIAGLGVIGLVEVLKNLRRLFQVKDLLTQYMKEYRPDVLVVIDYPGFNMKLAKQARKLGIPVVSFISPSAWAWGRGRAKTVADLVNCVAAIFPFEAEVYREAGAQVRFVGHPLVDIVKPSLSPEEAGSYFGMPPTACNILLMPGSRRQEIDLLLPIMLEAARKIQTAVPAARFYLPIASTIYREMLYPHLEQAGVPVQMTTDKTYDLMGLCQAAIAASGTATLETSLMGVPTVIIYKVNPVTYFLGKWLVKIPFIGLPNIIAGRRIMPELIQGQATAESIADSLLPFLTQPEVQLQAQKDLNEVRSRLGQEGAVKRVAQLVLEFAGAQRPAVAATK